jgi:hypothetical protein
LTIRSSRRHTPFVHTRLLAEGTRVVLLARGDGPRLSGIVSDVRLEPYLKPYVVTCDDGRVVYAGGYDLAREDDASVTPLAVRPEY